MWYANAIGYIFAVFVGDFAIRKISDRMWQCLGWSKSETPNIRPDVWQPRLTGIVERVLYVAAFQVGKPEFIGVWLALKVAGQWTRWSKEPNTGENVPQGRSIYQNFLIGNALSVIYALVGFKLIEWIQMVDSVGRSVLVSGVLLASTFAMWWYLSKVLLSSSEAAKPTEPSTDSNLHGDQKE